MSAMRLPLQAPIDGAPVGPTVPLSSASSATPVVRPPARIGPYSRHHKPLGDPAPLACTVAKAALETVLGASSLDTLVRWLSPTVRDRLMQQHSLARRAGLANPPRVAIMRARVCRVSVGAAEVSVVAYCDGHARAIAMRLEDTAGRWLVTAVEIG